MRLLCSSCFSLALVSLAAAPAVVSQPPQVPLAAAADARNAPGGTVVASLRAGTKVSVGTHKGADALVVVEGWVDASLLGPARDTFPASVGRTSPVRLRATPSPQGAILAEFRPGAGVTALAKSGTWTRVRRGAWIPSSALAKTVASSSGARQPAAQAPPPVAAAAAVQETVVPAPAGAMSARGATKLLTSPGGRGVADLAPGAVVEPLARARGWMRVRVEGWVNERDFAPADSAFGANLSAADLRADPDGTRGKVVRWEVQILSLQAADPLRRDMARDEPYLLAKGPGTENALLYLAVPPSLLSEVKAIPPLTIVIVTARVRAGRSEPVGTPILDLKTISRR
jgi:hypothetical protein